jgi:hypothetical protein
MWRTPTGIPRGIQLTSTSGRIGDETRTPRLGTARASVAAIRKESNAAWLIIATLRLAQVLTDPNHKD